MVVFIGFSTLLAGIVAVAASFAFPLTVKLKGSADFRKDNIDSLKKIF